MSNETKMLKVRAEAHRAIKVSAVQAGKRLIDHASDALEAAAGVTKPAKKRQRKSKA